MTEYRTNSSDRMSDRMSDKNEKCSDSGKKSTHNVGSGCYNKDHEKMAESSKRNHDHNNTYGSGKKSE